MKTNFNFRLNAHVTVDDNDCVCHVRHNQFWESEERIPRSVAAEYLKAMADVLQLQPEPLQNLQKPVSEDSPREQGVEYRLSEEKHLFDTVTVGYAQTYLNVPVWRKGIAVQVKQGPNRVVSVTANPEPELRGTLPGAESIRRFQALFKQITFRNLAVQAGLMDRDHDDENMDSIYETLGIDPSRAEARHAHDGDRLMGGKFFVYRYDARKRYAGSPRPTDSDESIPIPSLPPVSQEIEDGRAYLVSELIFSSNAPGYHGFMWLILVELETKSILYIECMTCGVNGLVFRRDPVVKNGISAANSASDNDILNGYRDEVLLEDLDPPKAGTQHLRGRFVDIQQLEKNKGHYAPDVAPPTQSSGLDFEFDARSDGFGAVSAYFHLTEVFRTIEGLGFPCATYFDDTKFPIPIDHRSLDDTINAHWSPNHKGGTGHLCFGLCDDTEDLEPLCRAVDPWVHWHEIGGHATLGDHVGIGVFGFAHSAGDGLAAVQMDPTSALRESPERYRYAPFRSFADRRFDRAVSDWAWGGNNDVSEYRREQILATCHFRIYQSIGGDHEDLGHRLFASRVVTYLILRTIGGLTHGTNPASAQVWCEMMMATDLLDWPPEGLVGGAYNKVIRWAFEKQGAYQLSGAVSPVVSSGAPPEIDVYIDDGRGGEYPFQPVYWQNESMWIDWNGTPKVSGTIKNRGTSDATGVTVRCYCCLPGAGLTWPNDFTPMSPLSITVDLVPAGGEATVSSFTWGPTTDADTHACVLMIVSALGDPSNVAHFAFPSETIAEWRLVPNDNNIGLHKVVVLPGGGGNDALVQSLDGAPFWAGNPFNGRARMQMRVKVPQVLVDKGWRLELDGAPDGEFRLERGEKRKITLNLCEGDRFSAAEIRAARDRDIDVELYGNDMLIGGMTYRIDPDLKRPAGRSRRENGPRH